MIDRAFLLSRHARAGDLSLVAAIVVNLCGKSRHQFLAVERAPATISMPRTKLDRQN
jgi:hypothetical protein